MKKVGNIGKWEKKNRRMDEWKESSSREKIRREQKEWKKIDE